MVASRSSTPSYALQTPLGELVLRVRGPGREGQVIRLRSVKCSIGSGSRCTLRLDARGVRAVHCVLFRGAERTIARRWAPDTRLNGNAFIDAELRPGDRLSIGPIELDVLETGAGALGRDTLGLSHAAPERNTLKRADEEARLREYRRTLDCREEAIRQQLATREAEQENLQRAQAELIAERERFQKEQAEWRSRQDAAERARSEQEEELHRRRSELQRRATEAQQAQEDARSAQEKLSRDLENVHLEEERLCGQIAKERERLEQERARLADERRQLELERAELDEVRNASEPAVADRGTVEVVAEEGAAESPAARADVHRRLSQADLLQADADDQDKESNADKEERREPVASGARPGSETDVSAPATVAEPPSEVPVQGDEISVDDYMAQLLRRVRGATALEPAPTLHAPASTESSGQPAQPNGQARPPAPMPRKAAKRRLRAPAPERTGFAAMRELANVSARSAVDWHARRQMITTSRSKLAVATTASLTALVLFWLWSTYLPIGVTLLAAGTSAMIALLWAFPSAVATGRLLIGRNGFLRHGRSGETAKQAAEVTEPAESRD